MKIEDSKPFSSGMDYEYFKEYWCERCVHYKLREDSGFPEFPELGGCRILDAMENARFDRRWWPCKKIVTEICKDGGKYFEYLRFNGRKYFFLPSFNAGTMYKGMEPGRWYTLEELGL